MQNDNTAFFEWMDNSTDQEKIDFFKNGIIKLLDVDEYEINHILYEFKTASEYVLVYFYLQNCNIPSGTKPSINPTKLGQEKDKIETRKKRILEDLLYLKRHASLRLDRESEAILKTALDNTEIDERVYSRKFPEAQLKQMKAHLLEDLIEDCNTGKGRAKEIVKILEYI